MTTPQRPLLSLLACDVADGVATITIERPEMLNGLNPAVIHQLHQAVLQAVADPAVRGIVLAGSGKAFVAGADLGFFLRNLDAGDLPRIVKYTEAGHALMNAVDRSPKPVVARLHGLAVGGGLELALACDVRVATAQASFGFPETSLGIYPGFGGTQRAARTVGVGLAKWLIYTGKTIPASDAWRIGLVDRLVPPEELDAACRACALGELGPEKCPARPEEFTALEWFFASQRAEALRTGVAPTDGNPALARAMRLVAAKAPVALRIAEQIIDAGIQESLEAGLQREIDHVVEIFQTQDAYAGLAHRARRQVGQPVFQGR